jgi:hypothetical protein
LYSYLLKFIHCVVEFIACLFTGQFDEFLGGYAQQYNAPGLVGATSSAVTTTEVAATDSGGSTSTSPLSTSAEIGIAIGCVALIALLALVIYFKERPRRAVLGTDSAGVSGVFSDHQVSAEPAGHVANPMSAKDASATFSML